LRLRQGRDLTEPEQRSRSRPSLGSGGKAQSVEGTREAWTRLSDARDGRVVLTAQAHVRLSNELFGWSRERALWCWWPRPAQGESRGLVARAFLLGVDRSVDLSHARD